MGVDQMFVVNRNAIALFFLLVCALNMEGFGTIFVAAVLIIMYDDNQKASTRLQECRDDVKELEHTVKKLKRAVKPFNKLMLKKWQTLMGNFETFTYLRRLYKAQAEISRIKSEEEVNPLYELLSSFLKCNTDVPEFKGHPNQDEHNQFLKQQDDKYIQKAKEYLFLPGVIEQFKEQQTWHSKNQFITDPHKYCKSAYFITSVKSTKKSFVMIDNSTQELPCVEFLVLKKRVTDRTCKCLLFDKMKYFVPKQSQGCDPLYEDQKSYLCSYAISYWLPHYLKPDG